MKVLHLLADWKLTGSAQPVLDLCAALRNRGIDVEFACRADRSGYEGRTLPREAAGAGFTPFELNGGWRALSSVTRVLRWIDERGVDVVHAHTASDHLTGGLAARWSRRRPPLVRTNHQPSALSSRWGERVLSSCLTDGYLCFSKQVIESETALEARAAVAIDPGLPVERYPALASSAEIRRRHDVAPDEFLFGMVMRVQPHRRFDVVIDAVELAKSRGARFKVLVVGRGTRREQIGIEPVRRRGLQDTIRFAGYVADGYVETLACFDAMIFLKTGSDGTARALREVQLIGRPAIVSKEGLLPELVRDGGTGIVVPLDCASVADGICRLVADPAAARAMGLAAREEGLARYDIRRAAEAVENLYRTLLRENKTGGPDVSQHRTHELR